MKNDSKPVQEPDYEQLAIKAQEKINDEIGDAFVVVYRNIKRLEKVGGSMDYKVYIRKILAESKEEVQMAELSQVLPDNAALVGARDNLEEANEIVVTSVKNRKSLKLVETA